MADSRDIAETRIRAALARLTRHGIGRGYIPPGAEALVDLASVQAMVQNPSRPIDQSAALAQVLRRACARLSQHQQVLLEIVLALEPEYEGLSALERRTLAGTRFRGGVRPVSGGTIRQYHEPRALDELAAVLAEMDTAAGESSAVEAASWTAASAGRLDGAGAIELLLSVHADHVHLSGDGADERAEHGGIRPGLSGAIDEIRRARANAGASRGATVEDARLSAPAVDDIAETGTLGRAGRLLSEAFLPGKVAGELAARIDRAERTHQSVRLGIQCDDRFARLPWEALSDPRSGGALALHPLVNIYRRVSAAMPAPVPGPLRILVAVSSPDIGEGALLDYERELRNVLAAVHSARQADAHVRIVPFATTSHLRSALEAEPVHVMHLSGHGTPGSFVLEDEDGRGRVLEADTFLDEAVPPGRMPAVIVLAACVTNVAHAPGAPSFAARLLTRGASVVIASETSVTDAYATLVFSELYGRLASAAVPDAVAAACDARRIVQAELLSSGRKRDRLIAGLGEWSVVSVLAGAGSVPLFDPASSLPVVPPPPRMAIGLVAARGVGDFVGRREEQRRWPADLLGPGSSGLVIHGLGGVGKTTLAAELASRVLEQDPLRVLAVLRGQLTVDGVLDALGAAIRRQLLVTGKLSGTLANALEAASRADIPWSDRFALLRDHTLTATPVLLVLDNFEDNLSAAAGRQSLSDPLLADLLAAFVLDPRELRLLITSRRAFLLPDAADRRLHFRALGGLSAAETRKLVWSLPALDKLDDEQVQQIWRLVGGHPRSIEYLDALLSRGTARYPDITARLTSALGRRLAPADAAKLLESDRQIESAIAEVATLAADDVLLDDLVDELDGVPGARDLLIGASVYREPVDTSALLFQVGVEDDDAAYLPDRQGAERRIVAVLESADIPVTETLDLDEIGSDVATELKPHLAELRRPPSPPRKQPDNLDECIDVCVASTLLFASPDRDEGRRVFVQRWTATELARRLVESAQRDKLVQAHERAAEYWQWRVRVWPQTRQSDVRDLLEARYHLLAADRPDDAGVLSESVCIQLEEWGAWDRETELIQDTLAQLPANSTRTAAWIHQLGIVAYHRGDVEEAETYFRRSLELKEQVADQAGIATSLHQLALLTQARGDFDQAKALYHRALELNEQTGRKAGMAAAWHQLGGLAQERGDLEEAEALYRRSLEINERLGYQAGIAIGWHQLAMVAQERGDLGEAEALYRRSLEINERLGSQTGMAMSWHQLGVIAQKQGDLGEAEALYRRSLEINERLGSQTGMAMSWHQLGVIAQKQGDLEQAEALYRRSLEINERIGRQAGVAAGLHQLSSLEAKGSNSDAGRSAYDQLGILEQTQGDLQDAETLHAVHPRISREPWMPVAMVTTHELGQVWRGTRKARRPKQVDYSANSPGARLSEFAVHRRRLATGSP